MIKKISFKIKFAVFSCVCYLMLCSIRRNEGARSVFDWKKRKGDFAAFINNETLSKEEYEDKADLIALVGILMTIWATKFGIFLILAICLGISIVDETNRSFLVDIFFYLISFIALPLLLVSGWWNSKFTYLSDSSKRGKKKDIKYHGKFYLHDIFVPLTISILFSMLIFHEMSAIASRLGL